MRVARLAIASAVLAVMAVSLTSTVAFASGSTTYVDDDGHGSRTGCSGTGFLETDIGQAVSDANKGDTIMVCPGVYPGGFLIDKRVTVRGVTPWTATVVPGPEQPAGGSLIDVVGAPGAKLKWLNLVAPTSGTCVEVGAMIAVWDSPNAQVRGNHISAAGAADGLDGCGYLIGIDVFDADNVRVAWNQVRDFNSAGIQIGEGASNAKVRHNDVSFYHASHAATTTAMGIFVHGAASGIRLISNVVRSLPSAGDTTPLLYWGIRMSNTAATIHDNAIRYTFSSLEITGGDGSTISGNRVRMGNQGGFDFRGVTNSDITNNFVHVSGYGINLNGTSSGNSISDNDFDGSIAMDCVDTSIGSGTLGTANTYTNNKGDASEPDGICTP